MSDDLGISEEKKKVFTLTTGDYSHIVFTELEAIFEWIEAEVELMAEDDEPYDYSIGIKYMTETQIENLPEADLG